MFFYSFFTFPFLSIYERECLKLNPSYGDHKTIKSLELLWNMNLVYVASWVDVNWNKNTPGDQMLTQSYENIHLSNQKDVVKGSHNYLSTNDLYEHRDRNLLWRDKTLLRSSQNVFYC